MKTSALCFLVVATTGWGPGSGRLLWARDTPQAVVQEEQKDPPDARKTPAAVTSGTHTNGPAEAALPPGDSAEFAGLIRQMFRDPLKERRVAQLRTLLEKFNAEHFAAMITLVRENDLRGTDTADEWSLLWMEWGQRDGAAALKKIREIDWRGRDIAAPSEAKYRALTGWAAVDPVAARQYLETTTDPVYPGHSPGKALIKGWCVTDPAGAAAWLLQKGSRSGEEYQVVVEAIFRRGGPTAVDEWLATLSRSHKPAAIIGFTEAAAYFKRRINPEMGAAWIDGHRSEKWIGESPVIVNTAVAYASRDPVAAMEWAERTGFKEATAAAMSHWCRKDLTAASSWLKAHRESPGYGTAVSVLVNNVRHEDPQGARVWAETIPDSSLREEVLKGIPQAP